MLNVFKFFLILIFFSFPFTSFALDFPLYENSENLKHVYSGKNIYTFTTRRLSDQSDGFQVKYNATFDTVNVFMSCAHATKATTSAIMKIYDSSCNLLKISVSSSTIPCTNGSTGRLRPIYFNFATSTIITDTASTTFRLFSDDDSVVYMATTNTTPGDPYSNITAVDTCNPNATTAYFGTYDFWIVNKMTTTTTTTIEQFSTTTLCTELSGEDEDVLYSYLWYFFEMLFLFTLIFGVLIWLRKKFMNFF